MSATEATAEVFVVAFKALKPQVRKLVWQKLVEDPELREDLADTLVLEARRGQSSQPLRDVLLHRKIQGGIDAIKRGDVAPLDMDEIKRKARAALRAQRERA